MRNLLIGVLVLGALIAIALFVLPKQTVSVVQNYDECVAAGNAVQESYPPVCVTKDGQSFTQNIGNEMEYADSIQVNNPRPNQVVVSPLEISGQARGTWYFEANFSAELMDSNGKVIGSAVVTAQSDWMTEDFVPFLAELIFDASTTETGTLVIKNANPSGLPQNDKTLNIPVNFK